MLGVNLPEYTAGLIPVFPNQLKVGEHYQHLFVGGLRQRANLAKRRTVYRIPEPQLERVKILHITDQNIGDLTFRLVHFQPIGDTWTSVASFQLLGRYGPRDNDMFFRDDAFSKRKPLLDAWENPLSGGRRRRKNRTRK